LGLSIKLANKTQIESPIGLSQEGTN